MPAHSLPVLRRSRTTVLYLLALLREFRWSLGVLATALLVGTVLFLATPGEFTQSNARPTLLNGVYAAWMAMLAQPINALPSTWYLTLVCGLYPIIGLIVIGEGVVRLALLLFSKRHGQKEWMKVMASTYRDHVVLCGIGHLGIRVLEELCAAGIAVVALEKEENGAFVAQAKRTGTPVILGDMKDDHALVTAGIGSARTVIIATNDDMANLEVALDARRLNPDIRVIMRLFEQSIAQKISNAFLVDVAFSASTLAAPMVAAMSMGTRVLSSTLIANIPHVAAEMQVEQSSVLANRTVEQAERQFCCKILARTPANAPIELPPMSNVTIEPGDTLVVHTPSAQLAALAAAGQDQPT
jgi:Trk K+ transport system NAD-binding subunit